MNKNILSSLTLSAVIALASGSPASSHSQELPISTNNTAEKPTLKLSGSGWRVSMERSNLGQQQTPIKWGFENSEVITLTWGIFQTRREITSSWAAPSMFVSCGAPNDPKVFSLDLQETAPQSCWYNLPTPTIDLSRDNDGLVVTSSEKPPAPLAVNLGRYDQPLESLSFSEDSFRIPNQGLTKVDSVNISALGANVNSNLLKINDSGWFDPRRKTNLPFLKNSR